MELFLNALWVALAVAAPVVWLSCYKGQLSRRELIAGSLAFACIAILLFPVISATDDVCAFQAATEESGPNKRLNLHALSLPGLAGASVMWAVTLVDQCLAIAQEAPSSYAYLGTINIFDRPPPHDHAA